MLWIHASSAARFEQGMREIADLVGIRGRDDPKANIFKLVRDWLRSAKSGRWTLILDNVDDASFLIDTRQGNRGTQESSGTSDTLFGFLPACDHGSILITTRSEDAARRLVEHSDMISVGAMSNSDALKLLKRKLGDGADRMDIADLARELENMPLALTQAAAYLGQMGGRCSVRKYMDKLQKSDKSKKSILDEDAGDLRRDREARNAIFLTWQISFEHVHKIRPSAAELLSLMSFCDRQAIPETLVRRHGSSDGSGTGEKGLGDDNFELDDGSSDSVDSDDVSSTGNAGDELNDAFDKDIRMLEGYSFVSPTTDASTFEMHRLVQVATRKWLKSRDQLERWKEQYIDNLCALFPPGSYENWSTCQIYYPHAQSAAELKPRGREAVLHWATVMHNAAWYARTRASAIDAEKMAVSALKARTKLSGEDGEDTLSSQAMLALAKKDLGRWDEAERLEVQVMETSKKVLGAEHPLTLTSMSNLASTYRNQGRWDEAEKLHVQELETRKKVLGLEHPDTLTSMANLASTYRNQGRWDEAEKLFVQVIETMNKVLGSEHPDTLTSMANLASTYRNQGRWDEAEKLFVQVIETRKKVLGSEHPSTLTSMANLASTYRNQGRWDEAEKLFVQVMETKKKVLGSEHPSTLTSMANLASTYWNQGRWGEAEELEVQVMETKKKVLGSEHPSTLTSMANLASTYRNQGRWDEAEKLEVQVIETMKKVLGSEHPDTLTSMANLASTYRKQGRWDKAEKLFVQVIETSKKVLGSEHPSTLTSMSNLALTLKAQGNSQSAYALMDECASISSRVLGMSHPFTVSRSALVEEWS